MWGGKFQKIFIFWGDGATQINDIIFGQKAEKERLARTPALKHFFSRVDQAIKHRAVARAVGDAVEIGDGHRDIGDGNPVGG